MINSQYCLKKYEELNNLSSQDISKLIVQGWELVRYDELVIDIGQLNHPGNKAILLPFINQMNKNIKASFKKQSHSDYAAMILCLKAIGKIEITQKEQFIGNHSQDHSGGQDKQDLSSNQTFDFLTSSESEGKQLFRRMAQHERFRLHRKTISKIDFSKPIFYQLHELTAQEKEVLTEIPIDVAHTKKIRFMPTDREQLMYTNDFWRSTFVFQFVILFGLIYLVWQYFQGAYDILGSLPYFMLGLLKWTLLEYYFHRFLLHYDMKTKPLIGDHLMHHAFPNLKNKLALSISKILKYMVLFFIFYSLVLQRNKVLSLLLGIMFGLTLYDIAHYYFHFGPQFDIGWLNSLKRNHLKHHFRDPSKGFGVSNTIWDTVFQTLHT